MNGGNKLEPAVKLTNICIIDERENLYESSKDLTNLHSIYVGNEESYIYFMNIILVLSQIIFTESSLLYGKH